MTITERKIALTETSKTRRTAALKISLKRAARIELSLNAPICCPALETLIPYGKATHRGDADQ